MVSMYGLITYPQNTASGKQRLHASNG